jgi:hypothetical protein
MRKTLIALAMAGIMTSPAFAQSQVPQQAPAAQAPAAEQKTEMKRVCQAVAAERTTGSRFGSTTRVCKMVEVPVEEAGAGNGKGDRARHAH